MTARVALVLALALATGCGEICQWNTYREPFELGVDTDLHAVEGLAGWLLVAGAEGTIVTQYLDDYGEPITRIAHLGEANLRAAWIVGTQYEYEELPTSFWVVGDGGTAAVSDNFGDTWNPIALPSTANLYGITEFSGRIVIVGDDVVLVRIADGTWIEPPTPPGGWGQLRAVGSHPGRIYAVGLDGEFWSSSDPSDDWSPMAGGIDEDLLAVGAFVDLYGYAPTDSVAIVGTQGTVLIADASGWTRLDTETSVDLIDYHGMHALGADGGIYRIEPEGPLILTETIADARALTNAGAFTVGAGGSATVDSETIECHSLFERGGS
jgi:hypothetical protein